MILAIKWECPKCSARPNHHGKGGASRCRYTDGLLKACNGFLCECEDDEEHVGSYANPCPEANCYHCGWGGKFPTKPKGIQPWERKALDAGWMPPSGWGKRP